MEEEVNNFPPVPQTSNSNLDRPFTRDSSDLRSSTTSTSGSTSPPDFLRHVQAAFKRHRPLGMMQSNNIKPRRTLMPRREISQGSMLSMDPQTDTKKANNERLKETQEDASITPPSEWGSTMNSQDGIFKPFNPHNDHQLRSSSSSILVPPVQKKVNFQIGNTVRSQDNTEWDINNNQGGGINAINQVQTTDISSSTIAKTIGFSNQMHQFTNFLQNDSNQPMTHSSSYPTSTLINSTSAPMHSSTTYSSSHPQLTSTSLIGTLPTIKSEVQLNIPIQPSKTENIPHGSVSLDYDTSKNITKPSTDVKSNTSNIEKQEKSKTASTSRKKGYDPDLFFKVNGKLYQRLGKIGSGGSSEVHKVISSDCKIYALKKIKLKGRDYATAYGFYQEIEYLNRLKGKNNIIQLIDYEVTDKTFLREVTDGLMSSSNKDGRVKEDGYIYMVLEYGEIDLAHMLSQKWKELDNDTIIGENWLRFYFQQILLAVNTIHEERIVHSDLKPANFLLVRGSLKLIDFGIAKAIMSDTTNIQRDSQVGTLSYMSPEAFMCNETDEEGKMIKCGRASDIWSLGCILYQMVYGKTPFAEYKTFWAKFKVITDPNHQITYDNLFNPWLLDIMKKCLSWDRNKRWRIPQLLQHPFLVPPVVVNNQGLGLIQVIGKSYGDNEKGLNLCSQLEGIIKDGKSRSKDEQCKLLLKMSDICVLLQEELAKSGKDPDPDM